MFATCKLVNNNNNNKIGITTNQQLCRFIAVLAKAYKSLLMVSFVWLVKLNVVTKAWQLFLFFFVVFFVRFKKIKIKRKEK